MSQPYAFNQSLNKYSLISYVTLPLVLKFMRHTCISMLKELTV